MFPQVNASRQRLGCLLVSVDSQSPTEELIEGFDRGGRLMMKEEAARSAVLWIFSDDIRASSMEELLSAPADYSEDKGTTPTGRRYPAAMHAWAVRKNGDDSMEIDAIVTALLDRIRPAKAAIADLAARGCQVRLELVLHASPVDRSTSSFLLSRDTVSDLQQMGASIAVNQYVNPRRFGQWFHGTEPAG